MDDLKSVTVRYLRELARKHLGRGHSTLRTREELIAALRKEAPGVLPGATSAGDVDARREAARARRLATGSSRTKGAPARSTDVRTTGTAAASRADRAKKAGARGVKAAVVAVATAVAARAVKAVARKPAAASSGSASTKALASKAPAAKAPSAKAATSKPATAKPAAPARPGEKPAKRPVAKATTAGVARGASPAATPAPVAPSRGARTPALGSPEAAAATRKQGGMSPPRRKPVPTPVAEEAVPAAPRVVQAPVEGADADGTVADAARPARKRTPTADAAPASTPKAPAMSAPASTPAMTPTESARPAARREAAPADDARPGARRTQQSAASARIPEAPPAQQPEKARTEGTLTPPPTEGPRTPPAHVVAFPPGPPRGPAPQRAPMAPSTGASHHPTSAVTGAAQQPTSSVTGYAQQPSAPAPPSAADLSHPPASAITGAAQGAALAAAGATPGGGLAAASAALGAGPASGGASQSAAAASTGEAPRAPATPSAPVEHAHEAFGTAQTAAEPLVEGFFVARVAGEEEARRHHLVGDGPHDAPPGGSDEGLGELAWGYGNDAVVLLPRDPGTLHVFWDFSAAARDRALEGLDAVRAVLRVFDGQGLVREEEFALESRSYYLRGMPPGRSYRVEAHFVGRDGRSRRIGPSSGRVALPPAGPSSDTSVRYLRVPLPQAARDSVGPPRPQRVTAPTHLVREYLHWRRIPLPGSAGFQDVPELRREEEVLPAPQPEAVPTPAGLPPHLEVRPRALGSSEQLPAGGPDAGWARPSDSGAGTWSGGSGAGTWSSGSGAGTWSNGSGSGGTKGEG